MDLIRQLTKSAIDPASGHLLVLPYRTLRQHRHVILNVATTIIPHSQQPLVNRDYPSESKLDAIITRTSQAQKHGVEFAEGTVAIGVRFMVYLTLSNHMLPRSYKFS